MHQQKLQTFDNQKRQAQHAFPTSLAISYLNVFLSSVFLQKIIKPPNSTWSIETIQALYMEK